MSDLAAQTDILLRTASIAGHLLIGILVGITHFAALRRNAGLIAAGSAGKAILLMASRFALTGGVLLVTSIEGAIPLLVTSAGLMLGRAVVLRRGGRRPE